MQLIFIHGSGGSAVAWELQTTYFKSSHAVDLPVHPAGHPAVNPAESPISSIEGYAGWLNQYIADRGYSDVVLAGHSLGGAVALMYGLMYPNALKGIVAIGSGAKLKIHPMFLDTLDKMTGNPKTFNAFINPSHEKIAPQLARRIKQSAIKNGPAVMLNDLRACHNFDIMDRLGRINVPCLALCGDRDTMTPPKYSQYLARQIPNGFLKIIQGGTHMVFAEKPEETNRAIQEFLTGIKNKQN